MTQLFVPLVRGFMQPLWTNNGLAGLYRDLQTEYGRRVTIKLYGWDSVDEIVSDISRLKPRRIVGGGLSYGASTLAFAAWQVRPWPIDLLVLTDPIWRPDPFDWTTASLRNKGQKVIDIPATVRNVTRYYQTNDWLLQGDKLNVWPGTEKKEYHVTGHRHWTMDRNKRFLSELAYYIRYFARRAAA